MAGRRKGGSAVGTVISTIVLIAAVAVFAYAAWMLYGYYREYKKGTDEYANLNDSYVSTPAQEPETQAQTETDPASGKVLRLLTDVSELEDPQTLNAKLEGAVRKNVMENGETRNLPMLRNPVDFAELHAINEEVIGWIRIGALNVSYPICQAVDNDYYLHRTFERVDNFAGCIFLNCDNSRFFTDQNTIIYGHNMKNGSMFGTLKKFETQETYDSNPYFWIFTEDFIYQYKIFSCSIVSKVGDPYRTRFTEEEFGNFLNTCQSASAVDNHGMQLTTADRIVTLSTCTGNDATRLIVQGALAQIYNAV